MERQGITDFRFGVCGRCGHPPSDGPCILGNDEHAEVYRRSFVAIGIVQEQAAVLERAEAEIARLRIRGAIARNSIPAAKVAELHRRDGWVRLTEEERKGIPALLAAAERYDSRLPVEQGGEGQHLLVAKLRQFSTTGRDSDASS